jgi:hypothetical protein
MNLWTRVQLAKTYYQMGVYTKDEFCGVLGLLHTEVVKSEAKQ